MDTPTSESKARDAGQDVADTVRIFRPPPRVYTDPLGQNIWMGDVEPLDLEIEETASTDPYDSARSEDPWSKVKR